MRTDEEAGLWHKLFTVLQLKLLPYVHDSFERFIFCKVIQPEAFQPDGVLKKKYHGHSSNFAFVWEECDIWRVRLVLTFLEIEPKACGTPYILDRATCINSFNRKLTEPEPDTESTAIWNTLHEHSLLCCSMTHNHISVSLYRVTVTSFRATVAKVKKSNCLLLKCHFVTVSRMLTSLMFAV